MIDLPCVRVVGEGTNHTKLEVVRKLAFRCLMFKLHKSPTSMRDITSCGGITTTGLGIMLTACLNAMMTVMHSMYRRLAEKYCGETETESCWIVKTGDEIVTILD